jgi:hypothetical protein
MERSAVRSSDWLDLSGASNVENANEDEADTSDKAENPNLRSGRRCRSRYATQAKKTPPATRIQSQAVIALARGSLRRLVRRLRWHHLQHFSSRCYAAISRCSDKNPKTPTQLLDHRLDSGVRNPPLSLGLQNQNTPTHLQFRVTDSWPCHGCKCDRHPCRCRQS